MAERKTWRKANSAGSRKSTKRARSKGRTARGKATKPTRKTVRKPLPFVVAPRDYAPALNIVGEHVTVLASGEATEGYEIFLQQGPEGSGPPPHSHPWDESFFVTKGQIDFGMGAESMTASPGTLVHLPAGTVHWFRFGPGGGEMLSMTSRLGASKLFTDLAREVAPVNPNLGKLAEVGARHRVTIQA